MRQIINNTVADLSAEEFSAIVKCTKILEEAFEKRTYSASINPRKNDAASVWGVAFSFAETHEERCY